VIEDERPLVLIVCSEPGRLAKLRRVLRESGVLPVSGRSPEAAASLLTQVQVNGCLVVERLEPAQSRLLESALERYSPGSRRFCVPEVLDAVLTWEFCSEEAVGDIIRQALQAHSAGRGEAQVAP
jgi:hypothetical protein